MEDWETVPSDDDFAENQQKKPEAMVKEEQHMDNVMGKLLQHDELPTSNFLSVKGKLQQKDYMRKVQQQKYCILCRRFADNPHVSSERHYKRIKWIEEMEQEERVETLKKTHKHTVEWFANKQKDGEERNLEEQDPAVQVPQQPARGGMKHARSQPSEPASSSTASHATVVKTQQDDSAKQESEHDGTPPTQEASEAKANADRRVREDDNAALASAAMDDNDYGTDPTTDSDADLGDADFALQLSQIISQQGHRRIWCRGSQAWLPVHCWNTTRMSDIHIQLGITFLISTEAVALHLGQRLLPRTGSVGRMWARTGCRDHSYQETSASSTES